MTNISHKHGLLGDLIHSKRLGR